MTDVAAPIAESSASQRPAASNRPALRPLALPTEHGGWGFLFEPIVLGLAVAPSFAGVLIAFAAILGFLTRQPLKLALQDRVRGRSYARTKWCWLLACSYFAGACVALFGALALSSWTILVPFACVAPLGVITLAYDAKNRSRSPLPEYGGAFAMTSTAASIALVSNVSYLFAGSLMLLLASRTIPAIMYIRALVLRAHGQKSKSWPSIAAHVFAVPVAYVAGSLLAAVAVFALLGRAAWALTHPVPAAKKIGWREIGWGVFTIAMFAIGGR